MGTVNHEVDRDEPPALLDDLVEEVCWRLIAGGEVARIAFVVDGRPELLPINYELMGDTVVLRTGEGSMLHSLGEGSRVVLEIDAVDSTNRTGWSVLVHGVTREIGDDLLPAVGNSLRPWAPGSKERWLWLVPDSITGRAISRPVPEGSHDA
jgi:hypothetical protein